MKYFACLSFVFFSAFLSAAARDYNIMDFGAIGNGKNMNTKFIQNAIDKCAESGGGRVIFPAGRFLTGSLHLKSGVVLYLDRDAVLLGSDKKSDYDKNTWCALLLARFQNNIGVAGSGTIDGQGRELAANIVQLWKAGQLPDNKGKNRPDEKYRVEIIEFENCRKVNISGVTIKDGSCWVETYRQCRDLHIDGIKVISTAYWNNDGMDIVDCTETSISNCDINSADDGICLKSEDSTKLCENITIKNCRVRSSASAIKFGTASFGGFKNITVKNIYVYDTYRSAIALEAVDGGILQHIVVDHIHAKNAGNAIFIRVGKRNHDGRQSSASDIAISNVTAFIPFAKADKGYETEGPPDNEPYNPLPSSIAGLRGHDVTDVRLKHIKITYEGGVNSKVDIKQTAKRQVPERVEAYPEYTMFGELPAWGFYLRHVKNISFTDVNLVCAKQDYRPAFILEDAEAFKRKRVYVNGVLQ